MPASPRSLGRPAAPPPRRWEVRTGRSERMVTSAQGQAFTVLHLVGGDTVWAATAEGQVMLFDAATGERV